MNKETIFTKLDIFEQTGFINHQENWQLQQIVLQVLFDFEMNKVDSFITHLVMSIERNRKKTLVDPIDSALFEQVRTNASYQQTRVLLQQILNFLDHDFNHDEMPYLELHLLNMVAS